jgi:hypothetical protein
MNAETATKYALTITVQLEEIRHSASYEISMEEREALRGYLSRKVVKGAAEDWIEGLLEGAAD